MRGPYSPLLGIVGPTGSGKSALALRLAASFPAEIVSCDALQVYRGADIGTGKLPVWERRGKCPVCPPVWSVPGYDG